MKTFFRVVFLHKNGTRQAWMTTNPPTIEQLTMAITAIVEEVLCNNGLKNIAEWSVISVEAVLFYEDDETFSKQLVQAGLK